MLNQLKKCPDRDLLVNYLLGKLPENDSVVTERHLSQCDPCVETVRGLEVHDTFQDFAKEGWEAEPTLEQKSDLGVVEELIDELSQWKRSSDDQLPGMRSTYESGSVSELQDRSAEVQHFFEASSDPSLLGVVGKYEIDEMVGAGSSGVVYRGTDTALGRTVAIKFLRPSLGQAARKRFIAEARSTALVNHPNVVPIYDVGHENRLAFIVMQWLPGKSLEQRLESEGPLSVDETIAIGRQIAEGLNAAHMQGIVHRDIKPANIWLSSEDQKAVILDFGLARITDEDPQLTCTGLIAGTPCFMSPEQTRGKEIDCRSDFFSLGCLLYQCLTGILPFKSDNVLSTLQAVQRHSPETPMELDPRIPVELSRLVMTLIEKSPTHRPETAQQIIAAFDEPIANWAFIPAALPVAPVKPKNSARSGRMFGNRVWPKVAFLMFAFFGLIALGAMSPQIIRVVTNQGVIEIESEDPNVKVNVSQNGELIQILDGSSKQQITVKAGEYEISPVGDGEVEVNRNRVVLSRGGKEVVRVTKHQQGSSPFGSPEDVTNQLTGLESLPADSNRNAGNAREQVKAKPLEAAESASKTPTAKKPYRLDSGDVLGIFVEGVLGSIDRDPPVHMPPAGSGLPPVVGFPIPIGEEGTIAIPLVPAISVRGLTLTEARQRVINEFTTGENPILRPESRILVNMIQPRNYSPPSSDSEKLISMVMKVEEEKRQLNKLKTQFSDKHPVVVKKELEVAAYQKALERMQGALTSMNSSADSGKTEPTYKGRTYDQWRRIVKFERNISEVVPAIRATIELMDDENRSEVIQASFDFFCKPEVRGYSSREVRSAHIRFAANLSKTEFQKILIDSLASGHQSAHGMIINMLRANTSDSLPLDTKLEGIRNQAIDSTLNSIRQEEMNSAFAVEILLALAEGADELDQQQLKDIERLARKVFSSMDVETIPDLTVGQALRTFSDSKDLAKAVYAGAMRVGTNRASRLTAALRQVDPQILVETIPLLSEELKSTLEKIAAGKRLLTADKEHSFKLIKHIGDYAEPLKPMFTQIEFEKAKRYQQQGYYGFWSAYTMFVPKPVSGHGD